MLEIIIAILMSLNTNFTKEDATLHVNAAAEAAKETGVPIEVILSIAYVESRFEPEALSYKECIKGACKRVTKEWRGEKPPHNAQPTFYCGVMQVGGDVPWSTCIKLRDDLKYNYMTGAKHLVEWEHDASCRKLSGDDLIRCGLIGYSGGYAAIKGHWQKYPNLVYGIVGYIRKQIVARTTT